VALSVRRLHEDDAALAHRAISVLKTTRTKPRASVSAGHLRTFLSRRQNIVIVAEDDGAPLGFMLAYLLDRADRDQTMMLFYEVGVAESHRRRGIGTKMVELLKQLCVGERVFKMWVHTNRSNAAAMALYRSTGGAPDGTGDEISFRYDFES
jgi:ribosomal protein S18 acetylase RimI-like enzyme